MRIEEIERELRETEATLKEALSQFNARRYDEAYKSCSRALYLLRRSFSAEDSRCLSCLVLLGDTCYELKRFDEAAGIYHEALGIRERTHDIRDHEYPGALFKLARSYAQTSKVEEADKYFRRAALAARKLMLKGDPLLGNILEAHAGFVQQQGRKNEAEALRREARANRQQYASSNQVVERYLEPLIGESVCESRSTAAAENVMTIAPGQGLIKPREREATIPPGELNSSMFSERQDGDRKKDGGKKALAVSALLLALFVTLTLGGIFIFGRSAKEKALQNAVPLRTEGTSGETVIQSASETKPGSGQASRKTKTNIMKRSVSSAKSVSSARSAPAARRRAHAGRKGAVTKSDGAARSLPGRSDSSNWESLKKMREFQ